MAVHYLEDAAREIFSLVPEHIAGLNTGVDAGIKMKVKGSTVKTKDHIRSGLYINWDR